VVVVNLDPHNTQSGWVHVSPEVIGAPHESIIKVKDLLNGVEYNWRAGGNFVKLDPSVFSAHVFKIIR
jgi:starch synthase (maltosyl-transferring)